jgi:dimethylamine/trimethylamine dehydrogenase
MGCAVTLLTPAAYVSDWTRNTLEQVAIHRRLAAAGVMIVLNTGIVAVRGDGVETNCVYTAARRVLGCDAVVLVTSRVGIAEVFDALKAREAAWADHGIGSVKLIGDAAAPGPIAWATYAGHRYARELDTPDLGDALPFRREIAELAAD